MSAIVSRENDSWHGAPVLCSNLMTLDVSSRSMGWRAIKNRITAPVVIRFGDAASWNPPLLPRREVTNPPHTNNWRTLAVSARVTSISAAMSCESIASLCPARTDKAFSAVLSRFGNSTQITGFCPLGVYCPKSRPGALYLGLQPCVIQITPVQTYRGGRILRASAPA